MKTQFKQVEAMRNPMAAILSNGCFRKQTVRAAKGKGSFRRQPKHRNSGF